MPEYFDVVSASSTSMGWLDLFIVSTVLSMILKDIVVEKAMSSNKSI